MSLSDRLNRRALMRVRFMIDDEVDFRHGGFPTAEHLTVLAWLWTQLGDHSHAERRRREAEALRTHRRAWCRPRRWT